MKRLPLLVALALPAQGLVHAPLPGRTLVSRRLAPLAATDRASVDRYSPEGLELRAKLFPDAPVRSAAVTTSLNSEREDDDSEGAGFIAQATDGIVETPDEQVETDFAKDVLGVNGFTFALGLLALLSVAANLVLGEGWLGEKLNLAPAAAPPLEPTTDLKAQAEMMRQRGGDLPPGYDPPPVEELLQRLPDDDYRKITGRDKPDAGIADRQASATRRIGQ